MLDSQWLRDNKGFGEMCVVADTDNKVWRTKIDPRGKVSLFVGCSTQHAGDVYMTEFRQPLQVQSHLEVPRILVQLGHIQRT